MDSVSKSANSIMSDSSTPRLSSIEENALWIMSDSAAGSHTTNSVCKPVLNSKSSWAEISEGSLVAKNNVRPFLPIGNTWCLMTSFSFLTSSGTEDKSN